MTFSLPSASMDLKVPKVPREATWIRNSTLYIGAFYSKFSVASIVYELVTLFFFKDLTVKRDICNQYTKQYLTYLSVKPPQNV